MQPTDSHDVTEQGAQPRSRRRNRLIAVLILLVVFLLIAFLPPLVNVSRFQRRIAANISAALGRPVHFDQISFALLPLPGFTLKTFVIDEDPAFGYEPLLRADEVQVTLRISSLWHPHVEVSKIAFSEPSVNLVRAPNGKWNIESLLLQASHIQAAPTDQRFAGPARRFPYIEATGARLNLKLDQEKMPVSFTDADFALWLPEPHRWRLRLRAHPVRTDTSPGDTGTIRVEGTLGGTNQSAVSLEQIPLDLHGSWQDAQLGGLSGLLLGGDPGVRGDFSLSFSLLGTVDHNTIAADIKLANARRAKFVPVHMLSLEVACKTVAGNTFHSFSSIECRWPPPESSEPSLLILTGDVPDLRRLESASAALAIPALPADTFFSWLSVATPHPPAVLEGAGTLSANLAWRPAADASTLQQPASSSKQVAAAANPGLTGQLEFSGASLNTDPDNNRSLALGDVVLRSTAAPAILPPRSHRLRRSRGAIAAMQTSPVGNSFDLAPVSLALGGKQPATLEGHFDANGYTLHLAGSVTRADLLGLGNAVPQIGDGLEAFLNQIADDNGGGDAEPTSADTEASREVPATLPATPIHIDLTAARTWGGPQVWRQNTPAASTHSKRR